MRPVSTIVQFRRTAPNTCLRPPRFAVPRPGLGAAGPSRNGLTPHKGDWTVRAEQTGAFHQSAGPIGGCKVAACPLSTAREAFAFVDSVALLHYNPAPEGRNFAEGGTTG
jgi:hypothetical protein